MTRPLQEFHQRAARIPFLGLGLSVDVYSPNVLDLMGELYRQGLSVDYLEIFHAHTQSLRTVRSYFSSTPMAYHAEGLWFTQPDWPERYQGFARLDRIAEAAALLDAWWINQECATKEINGCPVGTYVPPLFTRDSALLTAQQVWEAQEELGKRQWSERGVPMVLLEVPPLTYFGIGDLSYPEFFALVAASAPCGLVLDIGHVWTAFRYSEGCRSQTFDEYCEEFLQQFPLDRVVQIHVAGLACHSNLDKGFVNDKDSRMPAWIDCHSAPIPQELFSLLGKILRDSRLCHLKGVALEVDTKAPSLICQELERVKRELGNVLADVRDRQADIPEVPASPQKNGSSIQNRPIPAYTRKTLSVDYADYLELIKGKEPIRLARKFFITSKVRKNIQFYASCYLPHEILWWGGEIAEMFPQSCALLERVGVGLDWFVTFWFDEPWLERNTEFDFFLLKIRRFVEFMESVYPEGKAGAIQEAEMLREGYAMSCREIEFFSSIKEGKQS